MYVGIAKRYLPQTASHAFTFKKSCAYSPPPPFFVIALLSHLKTLKGQLPVTLNKMCSHCPQFAFVSSSFFFFCMCPIQSDTHIKILELFFFSQVHKADYFLPHPLIEGIQYNALLSLDTPQHTNWSRVSQL